MAKVTKDQANRYTTYDQYNQLLQSIQQLEVKLDIKLSGAEDTEENSAPVWGDISIISANYDTSFFVRWECRDPKKRELEFSLKINNGTEFNTVAWFNGAYYTCFVPEKIAKEGNNNCVVIATNGLYQKEKNFVVEIPKKYEPQAPNISQDISSAVGKLSEPVTIRYTATDNGTIISHMFYDGIDLRDITDKVVGNGSKFAYTTSWDELIDTDEAYIEVTDNEKLSAKSNKFKIIIREQEK